MKKVRLYNQQKEYKNANMDNETPRDNEQPLQRSKSTIVLPTYGKLIIYKSNIANKSSDKNYIYFIEPGATYSCFNGKSHFNNVE